MTNDRFERDVRHIVNTSADEGIRFGVKGCSDPAVLREALRRESSCACARTTLVQAIERRLRKLEVGS